MPVLLYVIIQYLHEQDSHYLISIIFWIDYIEFCYGGLEQFNLMQFIMNASIKNYQYLKEFYVLY